MSRAGRKLSMTTLHGTTRRASHGTGEPDSSGDDLRAGGREAPRPNPEVLARAKRRQYTAEYKQKVLTEADAARGSGEIGAVLRRHGLYSSHLTVEGHSFECGSSEAASGQRT